MTTIKTNCPNCGEVDLTPADIELHADGGPGPGSFYAFGCPDCRQVVHKQADERVARLLMSAGVTCITLPRDRRADLPAFTYDDLLDLHALLNTDGWFDELRSLVRL